MPIFLKSIEYFSRITLQAVSMLWLVIGFFISNILPEFIGQPFMDLRFSRSAFSQATLAMLLALAAWQLVSTFHLNEQAGTN